MEKCPAYHRTRRLRGQEDLGKGLSPSLRHLQEEEFYLV